VDDDRNDQEAGTAGAPVAPPVLGGVLSGPVATPGRTSPTAAPVTEAPRGDPWASPTPPDAPAPPGAPAETEVPGQPPPSPFAEAFWVAAATSEAPPSWSAPPGPAGAPPPPPGAGAWPPRAPATGARLRHAPMWLVVAIVAALVGAAAGAGIALAVDGGSSTTAAPTVKVGTGAPGPALAGNAQIPAIVKSVLPEVVSIDAKGPGGGLVGGTVEDQGTGMIISSAGEVITNNHVIAGATDISVTLYGQTNALPATLVGADPASDMALLRIQSPPANLQAVTFGDSTQLEVGDAVIAIGNALGLSAGTPTVTSGIVSALGRTVQAGDTGGGTSETLSNMIQTDAAINSGNSGGPLVDSAGEVVAMNTAVASSSSGNAPAQNIGFAIPSSSIRALLSTLRAGGTAAPAKAFLGVEVTDVTAQQQQAYSLVPSSGALVVDVVSGSPADGAGLLQGDVIVAFNGKAVTSAQDLTNDVQASSAGTTARLSVYRGPEKLTLRATLASAPAS